MRFRRVVPILITALLHCAMVSAAHADSKRFGEYEVIYSVFGTRFLQPEVAASYGIVRKGDRALLNVALLRRATGGQTPVAARVSGERGDLMREFPLTFREIREPRAIYYLAEFSFRNAETSYFNLSIAPEGDAATLELQFSKTLYEE